MIKTVAHYLTNPIAVPGECHDETHALITGPLAIVGSTEFCF